MLKKTKIQIIIISIIAALNCIFYLVVMNYPLFSDSLAFDQIAKNIINGYGFSLTNKITNIQELTMVREPLYPYFLVLTYKLSGINYYFTYILQGMLLCIISITGYFIANEIFNNKNISFLAGVLIAINPSLGNYTNHIMSELLFTCLITISLYLLILAEKKQQNKLFFISGITMGLSILTRSYSAMYIIILIPILAFLSIKKDIKTKNILKSIIVILIGISVTCLPWLIRNKIHFDSFSITYRGGLMLNTRAKELSMDNYDKKPYILSAFSEKITKYLYPAYDVKNLAKRNDKQSANELKKLINSGLSPQEADKLLFNNAIKDISRNIPEYIMFSAVNLVKMNKTYHLPSFTRRENTLKNPLKFFIKGTLKFLYLLTLLIALIAIIIDRKNYMLWAIPLSYIIFTNLIHSLVYCIPRYAVPIYPLYLIFASLGIYLIFTKHRNKTNIHNQIQ